MADWIHSYISAQDELGPINNDVRIHRVFYSMCQALFYVIAFRHKDFVYSKRSKFFINFFITLIDISVSRYNFP